MFGQKRISDYESYMEEVENYLENHNPYDSLIPLRMDLRKYLQYAEEHNITDVSDIPDEILDTFMIPEKPKRFCDRGNWECYRITQ